MGTALALGGAAPFAVASRASAAAAAPQATPAQATASAAPVQLTLPAPTGPHRIGVVDLRIVDPSRPDPVAGPGRFRELMISVWYPARVTGGETGRYPLAPWMPAASYAPYLVDRGFDPAVIQVPLTAGHTGAPVLCVERRLPVVVYSHGAHDHRSDNTVAVQELASHGYAVVTIDHTYDAWVAFPDGRVLAPDPDVPMTPKDFAADARSVLDAIEELAAGRNPDADRRRLPDGLAGALDPHRTGMFGWSKGGTATAYTMLTDTRVRAGLSFDGPMAPTVTADLDRPFMMMTGVFTRAEDTDVAGFWSHLTGWRLNVQPDGAVHTCYTDIESLMPQVAKALGLSREALEEYVGTLDPAEGVRMLQAYPLAFFDRHLRGRPSRLLDGPVPAFPDLKYLA